MKHRVNLMGISAATILFGAVLVSAQGPVPSKGSGMYNPATETTLKGSVEAVTEGARGQMMGTHLMVKTAEGTREVMLGPSQFIASKHFSFAKGNSVEVTGSKVTMGGTEYFVAREVVKEGKTLTLRDKAGTPEWAGKGKGRKGPPQ
jgi:hypothetical protein